MAKWTQREILTHPEDHTGASKRGWKWMCVLCDKYYALTGKWSLLSYAKRKLEIRRWVRHLLTTSEELPGGRQWFTGLRASDAKYLYVSFERLKFIRITFVMDYKGKMILERLNLCNRKIQIFTVPKSDLVVLVKSKITCMHRTSPEYIMHQSCSVHCCFFAC